MSVFEYRGVEKKWGLMGISILSISKEVRSIFYFLCLKIDFVKGNRNLTG